MQRLLLGDLEGQHLAGLVFSRQPSLEDHRVVAVVAECRSGVVVRHDLGAAASAFIQV